VDDLFSVKMGDKSLRYTKGKDTIRLKFLEGRRRDLGAKNSGVGI
jgi:hypothetical protein